METIDIKTVIIKWDLLGEGYEAPVDHSEKADFLVGKYLGLNRQCIITGHVHLWTQNTTFVLDVDVSSQIEFETNKTPTPNEIYQLYKQSKVKWNYEILLRSRDEGFNPLIILSDDEFLPFPFLEDDIKKAIGQSLVQNN